MFVIHINGQNLKKLLLQILEFKMIFSRKSDGIHMDKFYCHNSDFRCQQCEEKCPSTQAMLVGKLCKSRKVMEEAEKIGSRK